MQDKPVVALVTRANKGIGLRVAKDLVAHGFTVLIGSRNRELGEAAATSDGADARALRLALLGADGPTDTPSGGRPASLGTSSREPERSSARARRSG